MIYYKIIKENFITDIACGFFKFQPPHYNIVSCDEAEAELLRSSDKMTVYTTDWLRQLPKNIKIQEVVALRITEEEYLSLEEQLKKSVQVALDEEKEIFVEPDINIQEEDKIEEQPKILTIQELYNKIELLEKEIHRLQNK